MNLKTAKILLTGGHGFLGTRIYEQLLKAGAKAKNISRPTSKALDLTVAENCRRAVRGMDLVINAAAKMGGIGYTRTHGGESFYQNLIIGLQLMEAARLAKVKKFVQVGTVCSYPQTPPHIPFREEDLWKDYPEPTNGPYGIAKKTLLVQSQAYREQYGFNGIHLLLTNLYGPGDNFSLESSHVIPALIRKCLEAVKKNKKEVVVWGTGIARREFLYVDDAARAIVLAAQKYDKGEPINVGSAREIKIKDLVKLIAHITGFKGKIVWDKTKPNGQLRRKLDVSKAKKQFGFSSKVGFKTGLKNTIEWYKSQ